MTCTRPEAISSFVWYVCVVAGCYYDYFLFIDYAMCFVFGYRIFSDTLNSVRAVGKFNQAGV